MISGHRLFRRAIPALAVGVALLFVGCAPKFGWERPKDKEPRGGLFAQAEQDFKAGDLDRAFEGYKKYVAQSPKGVNAPWAFYRMGKIQYDRGAYREALDLFERIQKNYPGHPQSALLKYDIANAYYRLGDHQRSDAEAAEWLKAFPDHPLRGEVLLLRGKNHEALEDDSGAFYWWVEAYRAYQGLPDRRRAVYQSIAGLIESSDAEELAQMREDAADTEFAPHLYYRLASLNLEANRLKEAAEAATALLQSAREEPWVSRGREILERCKTGHRVKAGTVGCLLPLTGPFAIYGQEVLNGIQLGMGLFTDPGEDQTIDLVIKDTRGNPEDAVSGLEELAGEEKVLAVIGPLASKTATAAAKRAQELGVPIITLTQKDSITEEGDMVFRNFLTPAKEIQTLLDRTMGELGWQKFGILYPDNSYGRFFMGLFWDSVERMGGAVTAVESYREDQTDFADEIKKMVGLYYPRPHTVVQDPEEGEGQALKDNANPGPVVDFDAVFLPDNHQRVALVAPQFPFHDVFNVRFLGTSMWESPELVELAGEYIQGAIFPSGFFAQNDAESVRAFVELYRESFESEPGILAATGYDTIRFLKYLIEKGGISNRRDFQQELLAEHYFHGLTGKIAFDSRGEVEKTPLLIKVSGRELRVLP